MCPDNLTPGVYVEETPHGVRAISGVSTATAAFIGAALRGPTNRAVPVRSAAEFDRRFGGLVGKLELGYALHQFFLNGGADARVVRVAQRPSAAQVNKALQALDTVDVVNLLALPGIGDAPILEAAAHYSTLRRAFLIIDAPEDARTPDQITRVLSSGLLPRTSYAALYYPRVWLVNPLTGNRRATAPSGTIAGLMARSDSRRGVWKAAAGMEASLAGVQGLEYDLNDDENGRLYSLGINCLRQFPAVGPVAWGARTLSGDPEYKYVPVRRLALFLEESIFRGTQWAVFEPNGEPLWAQIRLQVGAFMRDLFHQGAFAGSTPTEAYLVRCDAETTTQADRDREIVKLLIGFAPLKPAEFVMISVQQKVGQSPP